MPLYLLCDFCLITCYGRNVNLHEYYPLFFFLHWEFDLLLNENYKGIDDLKHDNQRQRL